MRKPIELFAERVRYDDPFLALMSIELDDRWFRTEFGARMWMRWQRRRRWQFQHWTMWKNHVLIASQPPVYPDVRGRIMRLINDDPEPAA